MERRYLNNSEMRMRIDVNGTVPKIFGYAAVFNSLSEILTERVGGQQVTFREVLRPGAFTNTLKKNPDIRALINHDSNLVLGRNKSGTLRLWEDNKGLAFEIDPGQQTYTQDLIISLRRGDVNACSFAFVIVREDFRKEGQKTIHDIDEVDMAGGDVSVVTYPAFSDTECNARFLRSLEEWETKQAENEKYQNREFQRWLNIQEILSES